MKTPQHKTKPSINKRYEIDCSSQRRKRKDIQLPPISKSVNIDITRSINNKNDTIDPLIEDNEEFNEIID